MKEITAIIQPSALSRVMQALHALPNFPGVTLFDAHGQGLGRGTGGGFRPTEENFTFYKKTVLVINCEAASADLIANTLVRAAHTGRKGDGVVTIKDVASVIRIRVGQTR
jgi:nitrogen regulatory protein P-II 1